ncbi:MAG: sulfite exporter TauE/SafE family protein, partial [Sedimentisphaerales bacterium]|nr:sulfite exporter TauE/SafE family protein [Sedimentisphaerales bacterium]
VSDIALVFLVGLFGSLHCVAMCGGLVMACSMRFGGGVSFSLKYNAGRVLMYALLGLLMGFLGKALIAAGLFGRFQSVIPVAAGLFMVLIGLELLGVLPGRFKRLFSGALPSPVFRAAARLAPGNRKAAPFLIGMLNGLIPCGMLYAAGIKAASTADPGQGAMIMAALGAGNFLPLLFAGSFSGFMRKLNSGAVAIASSVLIIALGVKSIIFGIGFTGMAMALHAHF